MNYDQLKLENQLCFPVYAASRLITRKYQPYLDKLGITYPQYLVLMILWENDGMPVNDIAKKLILNTNTITPLLKRMECNGIVTKQKSCEDERKVIVLLTEKGRQMRDEAVKIPQELATQFLDGSASPDDIKKLKEYLENLINILSDK